jgi:hypothetical protein
VVVAAHDERILEATMRIVRLVGGRVTGAS